MRILYNIGRYGADTEDIARISAGLPGFPITITATYHHLKVSTNNESFFGWIFAFSFIGLVYNYVFFYFLVFCYSFVTWSFSRFE